MEGGGGGRNDEKIAQWEEKQISGEERERNERKSMGKRKGEAVGIHEMLVSPNQYCD